MNTFEKVILNYIEKNPSYFTVRDTKIYVIYERHEAAKRDFELTDKEFVLFSDILNKTSKRSKRLISHLSHSLQEERRQREIAQKVKRDRLEKRIINKFGEQDGN